MKKRLIKALTGYVSDNKLQYAAVIAALFIGLVWGSVSASSLNAEDYGNLNSYMENVVSSYSLQPVSRGRVFMSSLAGNLKTVALVWLSGLWVPFIPFSFFQMGLKGYKVGFSMAFMVSAYKVKGILFSIMSMLPQMLIFLPALTVFAVFGVKYAVGMRKMRHYGKKENIKREMYLRNALCTLGMIMVVLVCGLIDAYIIPPVLKPVCSYMVV